MSKERLHPLVVHVEIALADPELRLHPHLRRPGLVLEDLHLCCPVRFGSVRFV